MDILLIGAIFGCAVLYIKWQKAVNNPVEKIVYKRSKKSRMNLTDSAVEIFCHIASYVRQNSQIFLRIEQNVSYTDTRYNIIFLSSTNNDFDNNSYLRLEGMSLGFAEVMELIKQECNNGSHLVIVNSSTERRCYLVTGDNFVKGEIVATSEKCYYEEMKNV